MQRASVFVGTFLFLCTSAAFHIATAQPKRSIAGFSKLSLENDVICKTSIFDKSELAIIEEEVNNHRQLLQPDSTNSIAVGRLGISLPGTSPIINILKAGSLSQLVQRIAGDGYTLAREIPVDIRVYERRGSAMAWHVDDVWYSEPEVIWTLENTSDCETRCKQSDGREQVVETVPNSVLLLQAGGASHCVTSLSRGRRVILKCAYGKTSADFLGPDDYRGDQFAKIKRKQRKKRR